MIVLLSSLTGLLLLAALVTCIHAAMNRIQTWVPLLLLIIANLVSLLIGTVG